MSSSPFFYWCSASSPGIFLASSTLVTYELREKDGGTEFDLIIERAIEGSDLHKQMIGGQVFIAKNLKSLAETGKPAFSGKMVTLMTPMMGLFAKKEQRIEHWPLERQPSDQKIGKEA